jgi:hypothetical protein
MLEGLGSLQDPAHLGGDKKKPRQFVTGGVVKWKARNSKVIDPGA